MIEYSINDGATIIHFKKKDISYVNSTLGSDLPGFHLDRVTKKIELALVTRAKGGNLFRFTSLFNQRINAGEEYNVYVEMRENANGCTFVSKINKSNFVNLGNLDCVIWNDVEVWMGGPWNSDGGIEVWNFKYAFL